MEGGRNDRREGRRREGEGGKEGERKTKKGKLYTIRQIIRNKKEIEIKKGMKRDKR